jgi:hypothetical protein
MTREKNPGELGSRYRSKTLRQNLPKGVLGLGSARFCKSFIRGYPLLHLGQPNSTVASMARALEKAVQDFMEFPRPFDGFVDSVIGLGLNETGKVPVPQASPSNARQCKLTPGDKLQSKGKLKIQGKTSQRSDARGRERCESAPSASAASLGRRERQDSRRAGDELPPNTFSDLKRS